MRPSPRLLVTIPARLAQPATVSATREDARTRALALYRDFYRSAPEICALYALDVPPSTLRAKYRELFERNRHIDDLAVIDVLLHKGRVDFQETINAWKQIPHIMKIFAEVSPIAKNVCIVPTDCPFTRKRYVHEYLHVSRFQSLISLSSTFTFTPLRHPVS